MKMTLTVRIKEKSVKVETEVDEKPMQNAPTSYAKWLYVESMIRKQVTALCNAARGEREKFNL